MAIILQDGFEYEAARTEGGADAYTDVGPWDICKAINTTDYDSYNGYIYNVTSIDGFSGSFPGLNSKYVKCDEILTYTMSGQSDTYVGLSNDNEYRLPANAWIQFWIYMQDYGTKNSKVSSDSKFFYPCPGTFFP